jgi:hypothetical protein
MRNLFALAAALLLLSACDFARSQAATGVAATCQHSCGNVAANTQSDCQTSCVR